MQNIETMKKKESDEEIHSNSSYSLEVLIRTHWEEEDSISESHNDAEEAF